jgi:hypothetical protein
MGCFHIANVISSVVQEHTLSHFRHLCLHLLRRILGSTIISVWPFMVEGCYGAMPTLS